MLIYITGGARSGKSRYAQELAGRLGKRVVFVATSKRRDAEMKKRIDRHRRDRPAHWTTIEDRLDLADVVAEAKGKADVALIDCLNMFVAGRLVAGENETRIAGRVEALCRTAAASRLKVILISNEVGSGLIPSNRWGRRFIDDLGRANQIAARHARTAYLLVSGLPVRLKGPLAP